MNAPDASAPFVLRRVTDGSGREHDLYVVQSGDGVVLSCPSAFWSVRLNAAQGELLAPAIKDASARARQVSR